MQAFIVLPKPNLIVPSSRRFTPSATANANANVHCRNYYDLLGVPQNASLSHIKRAYRLLALKYHPDVNKEKGANEDFKSIRVAYETLINEVKRNEYDKDLHHQHSHKPLGDEWGINEDGHLRRKMQRDKYWEERLYEESPNEEEERGSLMEVVGSAFVSVFLMQTVGFRLSLTFSGLMALVDRKLDAGYKLGYLIAWVLGGRAGILLTMVLSFASWFCGKTSSSVVALVVVALCFGSRIPQGALLTLLYMSLKLQLDLT